MTDAELQWKDPQTSEAKGSLAAQNAMSVVGGIMLICIALRLLNMKNVAVGNLLPALAIAPAFALLVHSLS